MNNYCNITANRLKSICKCINPPQSVLNAANNMLAPYYCWYSACLSNDTLKTPDIITAQASCNITFCNISIDQIQVKGGRVIISNTCAYSSLLSSSSINLTPFEFSFKLPVLLKTKYNLILLSSLVIFMTVL